MNPPNPSLSRRGFLQQTSLLAAGAFVMTRSKAAPPKFNLLGTSIISLDHANYHGWPTVLRRANGQLMVVCSGGREQHVCPFGRVDLIVSNDDGETWGWPRTLLDSDIDDRDAGILETKSGALLVTTFTSLAYEPILAKASQESESAWPPERLKRWNAAHQRLSTDERQAELGQWMIRSTDGGRTWSPRYSSIVNSPHGPIQLSDGRLLYAGKELWTGEKRAGFCQSTDDGQSWTWLAELPVLSGDRMADYHELHAVECSSGKLIAHIRNHNSTNDRETLQSHSDDGGQSWSEPYPIGVWGLPSHLLRLHDDALLMTYGHRQAPLGVQARLSRDEGKTWSDPMILSIDGAWGDLGYPSTVELDDNTLVTVWYEQLVDNPRAVLRQAKWRMT